MDRGDGGGEAQHGQEDEAPVDGMYSDDVPDILLYPCYIIVAVYMAVLAYLTSEMLGSSCSC